MFWGSHDDEHIQCCKNRFKRGCSLITEIRAILHHPVCQLNGICVVLIYSRQIDTDISEGCAAFIQNVEEQQKALIHVATNSDKDVEVMEYSFGSS
jgi:hypothetical protein